MENHPIPVEFVKAPKLNPSDLNLIDLDPINNHPAEIISAENSLAGSSQDSSPNTKQIDRISTDIPALDVSDVAPSKSDAVVPGSAKKIKARKLSSEKSPAVDVDAEHDCDQHENTSTENLISTAKVDSPFYELELHPSVVEAVVNSGYTIPTPIQKQTIPHVLARRDIIGKAETGSGKTAAFACPLLSMLDVSIKKPQILVLAPTRELAIQVTESFQRYGADLEGFRAVTIYGGQSYEIQHNAIRRGVQVVVGTPGRVMDHLRQRTLDLSNLTTIVLDEADEMLRMGFIDDVEWILSRAPEKRQTLLFSATMPAPIQRIAQNYLSDPVTVSIETDSAAAESITQSCLLIQPRVKVDMLAQILDSEPTDAVIVFVKTRDATVMIADRLSERGFSAAPLNGDIPQNQRERTVEQLKSGRLNILVATDVAARGLDVQRISHVINYDFPHDTEAYIHRIGRTGRAGREGAAILFVEPKERGKLKRLQRETNQDIQDYRPKSVKEINAIRVERFKQRITDTLENQKSKLEPFAKIINQYQQQHEVSAEELATALAWMAQGDTPLLLTELVKHRTNFDRDSDGRKERGGKRFQGSMATYRVEVGRKHGVKPGNIVGAITNEAELSYASIGRIKLHDEFSLIDLPANLTKDQLDDMQLLMVSGRQLRISRDQSNEFRRRKSSSSRESSSNRGRKPQFGKPSFSSRSGEDRPRRENKFSKKTERGTRFGSSSTSKASGQPDGFAKGKPKRTRDQSSATTPRKAKPSSEAAKRKFIKIRG